MFILSAIALTLTLFLFFYGLPVVERELRNYYFNKVKWKSRINRHQFVGIDKFYASRFSYYKQLTPEGRARFIFRALQYLEDWTFEGRRGLEADMEKKLLVCGSAAQLTYRLDHFRITHFDKIFLYPETFYSDLAAAEVKGLTYSLGHIAFSWKDFEEGYRIENDGYNLGLHEMAHALDINRMKTYGNDNLLDLYFPQFIAQGVSEFQGFFQRGEGFLRDRANTNEKEFFAICVESFFERPEEFREKLPNIFNHLCAVLQQNPLNKEQDYQLSQAFIEEANQSREIKIPYYKRFFFQTHTPGAHAVFSLLMFPGFVMYILLLDSNQQHISLINYLALAGGLLFLLVHSKTEIIKNKGRVVSAMNVFNFLRGATLCAFTVFVLNNSIWHYPVHKHHRLHASILHCEGANCRLKNLPEFDYPIDYRLLSNYSFSKSKLAYFEANNIPVYLEERSDRGLFGLINHLESAIVVGESRYPLYIRP